MTRSKALSDGFCTRCASYSGPVGDVAGRHWCAFDRQDDACTLDPAYGEWLRLNFGLPGPRMADDLGAFAGLKPAGRAA